MKAIGFDLGWYPFDSQLFENRVIKSQIIGKFSVKTCLKYHECERSHYFQNSLLDRPSYSKLALYQQIFWFMTGLVHLQWEKPSYLKDMN
jgi:hypothetical protein